MSSDAARDLALKINTLREQAEEYEVVLRDLRYQHWLDIDTSQKELGLTNETKRKMALELRLETDETYSRIAKELRYGVNMLKSCIDQEELDLLREYIEADERISEEDKQMDFKYFDAVEILLGM
ncbi:hypothetical protein Metho_1198 [Methanomethylovorans hollandica DSM 15978]|uniref:Uncharacterized protein n=1 Tax=Methanomethylovorans hollandica (strain DSM 15978 / NBRC 107637 / DMS1) TaxID=867904 RepID=L0KZB2_METHD|nr:hypothetical protein [Methanomethylovorans hollandica]AGB49428.1 hypothetical protein Metho_1198 [Methanomethylovorans hollandica DSM 15978]